MEFNEIIVEEDEDDFDLFMADVIHEMKILGLEE